jgi:hypothetical protein
MPTSIHRVGLALAAIAALVTVGGAYIADGYFSAQGPASVPVTTRADDTSGTPSPTATLPPDVVYVRPAPSPKVIHVRKVAPPVAPKVVHVTVPTKEGESGAGERDDGGGD